MLERAKSAATKHKTALLVILCLLLVVVAYAIGRHSAAEQTATEKPAVMSQEQTQDKDGQPLPPEEQKVDVYKVNLNKPHKVKVGMTQVDARSYWSAGVQVGRWEGVVHGQSGRMKGGSVMYTIAAW